MKSIKTTAVLALLAILTIPVSAELQFDQKEQTITLTASQPHASLSFSFANTGPDTIGIFGAEVSCTCLKLEPVEKDYIAGERGAIVLKYIKTNRPGPQSYKITLHTTDSQNPMIDLRINITNSSNYILTPGSTHWIMGQQASSKDILFKDIKRVGVRPTNVYSTNPNFHVEIKAQRPNGVYPITITALSTGKATAGYIYVDVTSDDGSIEKAKIIAAVRDPNSQKIILR